MVAAEVDTMGHWAPTTLGNDHAWDVLGDLGHTRRTHEIERMVAEGLSLDRAAPHVDAWTAPRLLALAEAVAAGLGRPSPELLPKHAEWCAAHADLLAAHVEAAHAVLGPIRASPYARGWREPDGPSRFLDSLTDLDRRLQAGRSTPLAPPADRLRRAFDAPLQALGWQSTAPDVWRRSAPDGGEYVRLRLRQRAGRSAVLVWLSRDFPAEQAHLHAILGKEPPDAPVPAAIIRPPPGLWDRLGDRGWVPLFRAEDPAGTHRELAVRVAAEKSMVWVERYGQHRLARLRGPALAEFVATTTMDQLRKLSAAHALLAWVLVAQRVAPGAVDRLVQERRVQLARVSDEAQRTRLLDQLHRVHQVAAAPVPHCR